jgi:hypothetical protein
MYAASDDTMIVGVTGSMYVGMAAIGSKGGGLTAFSLASRLGLGMGDTRLVLTTSLSSSR